ncbi:hypothetical protein H105_00236 [Trichophyton soudanense CBS 452.61]|uniref:Glycerophosphocholine acyltransferase 1 n=1 Tax=Trichophyton soudanense CBS 452.61 TaxID=1215331 RepID=A0A022Y8D4_TRISD|nr:hypothetical protein H105_00236 [Trichophyton soudanense CBS 452.61]EZF78786.1 hypothetical protein H105_00236 [Trichophyton soudanense CBS 452.61]EZG11106.1 hypothetical protein H106_00137 [Trichophyton rubrum CBS 735.88]EZG11107.1 hypothetical protein H106_00137 [Trichophyton rubrum CBS 735.88]
MERPDLQRVKSEPVNLPQSQSAPISSNVETVVVAQEEPPATTPEGGRSPLALSPLSRISSEGSSSYQEDWEPLTPVERVTVLDLLGNLAISQKLEKWQASLNAQKERVKRHQEKFKSTSQQARQRVVGEFRKRMPSSEEQLQKYRKRMKSSVERLAIRWNDTVTVTAIEKISFIAGVLNVFISGYLLGAFPTYFYLWFTGQLIYFMPQRYYRYCKIGYHYFLADLCYFVNLLTILSVWVFPNSKRLFLSTWCLAYGNNAVAIAMWRNSMVFHSIDKVVSLFIHIMPPVTLHCLVHLTPPEILETRFPAVYRIKFSAPGSPEHYTLGAMMIWASVPYAIWQLSYHFFITVRQRDKIAAGRPTSFTWLRRSYAKTWIGKFVLHLSLPLQEPAFMMIQYIYAILTIVPCPLWFWYQWASSAFLTIMFIWSIYNGATFYIDVFGKRFQKELEQLKRDVAKWQMSPEALTAVADPQDPDGIKAASLTGVVMTTPKQPYVEPSQLITNLDLNANSKAASTGALVDEPASHNTTNRRPKDASV